MKLSEAKRVSMERGSIDWFIKTFFKETEHNVYQDGTVDHTVYDLQSPFLILEKRHHYVVNSLSVTVHKNNPNVEDGVEYEIQTVHGDITGIDDPRISLTVYQSKEIWNKS